MEDRKMIQVTESAHRRIMDRRSSNLRTIAEVVDHALDCMDKVEEEK